MKNVMVRAWEIAKGAVNKFGGAAREYFAQALSMAWQEENRQKKVKAMTNGEWNELVDSKIVEIKKEVKRSLLYYGSNIDWVKEELNDLVEQAIYTIRNERMIYPAQAAYYTIDKHF